MSGALRHRRLDGMDDEGWVPVRTASEFRRLNGMHTTMGDIRLIVAGGDDHAKRRFELIQCGRCIRCAQGHPSGSGVRPDVLPIERRGGSTSHMKGAYQQPTVSRKRVYAMEIA